LSSNLVIASVKNTGILFFKSLKLAVSNNLIIVVKKPVATVNNPVIVSVQTHAVFCTENVLGHAKGSFLGRVPTA
jgi:hypothetical protein